MTEVENTSTILYRYLRTLSVKVSKGTVYSLLDTPVGNSMRGISDALDALHIKNEVYQLPASLDYLLQLDAPFITMLEVDKNPFCVVTKKNDFIVEFTTTKEKQQIEVDTFLKKWKGIVLLGEVTEETSFDSLYLWKNISHFLLKYKLAIAIFFILTLGFLHVLQQKYSPIFIAYLATLSLGILTSVTILYKEQFNESFLEGFCHIGKTIDCNKVLHSKGASIAGTSLGELSLLYFFVLFLFSIIQPQDSYGIVMVCSTIAICFTIYSIAYQIFIIHKGCILCMLVNVIVWGSTFTFYVMSDEMISNFSILSTYSFTAISCIGLIILIALRSYHEERKEKYILRDRFSNLFTISVFQKLLELQPFIKESAPLDIAINNHISGENRLLIITNPTCKSCAKAHPDIKELSSMMPISLILITHPKDKTGTKVAETILAAYMQEGWSKAIALLDEWFENQSIKEAYRYIATSDIEDRRNKQTAYCWKHNIDHTPSFLVNGHYIPKAYSISNLKYILA